mmetsp:Transcript_5064/g.15353  ORF Transcript_5064/g.15353 Transcript_5064/m.15353 type:complete len:240 (+) Transcript_5064:407-1126(+)
MDLHEGSHAQGPCALDQVAQVGVWEDGGDQEDGVRALGPGMKDLVGLHDELLAQEGAPHPGAPDELQVVKAALEVLLVREHGDASRTAGLVLQRDVDGVKVLLDDSLGRGGALALGDEPGLSRLLVLGLDRSDEVPGGLHESYLPLERREVHLFPVARDFLVLEPHNLLQDVPRLLVVLGGDLELQQAARALLVLATGRVSPDGDLALGAATPGHDGLSAAGRLYRRPGPRASGSAAPR